VTGVSTQLTLLPVPLPDDVATVVLEDPEPPLQPSSELLHDDYTVEKGEDTPGDRFCSGRSNLYPTVAGPAAATLRYKSLRRLRVSGDIDVYSSCS
jgi:hypothetical protein